MPTFYFYNSDGLYTSRLSSNQNRELPSGATLVAPEFQKGFWPVWDGEQWEKQEDHRKAAGYVDGQLTVISELGPLPDGWTTDPPEQPEPEQPEPDPEFERQQEIQGLKNDLDVLDRQSVRSLRELAQGTSETYNHNKLATLESQAASLRADLQELLSEATNA
jgi:hypothetical protein